jgi:hypothetical protein
MASGLNDILKIVNQMNNLFRGLLAGAGAKWLGGGIVSTIIIFFILWAVLGQCSEPEFRLQYVRGKFRAPMLGKLFLRFLQIIVHHTVLNT